MKTKLLSIVLLLVMAMQLAGCAAAAAPALAVPKGAQPGALTRMEPCEFQPSGAKAKYVAECGTLSVPENWEQAGSRLIAVPVVRIPARGPHPEEPVFYLAGGPGGPNLSFAPPAWLLEKHDVVEVGYRGAEGSVVLRCPEVTGLLKANLGKGLWSEQKYKDYSAGVRRCADRHQQAGVDLAGYTVTSVIADIEAARQGLGYDRINLFSVSYGTRIAQIYAYMHPSNLRRIVMVGVNTPGHFIFDPAVLDDTIHRLSGLCAKDASCSSRTSSLAQTMYDLNHNMPKRWLLFNIDPDTIRLGTHLLFYSNRNMPMVIDAYLAAGNGDPSGLAMMSLILGPMFPADQIILGDQFSKGASLDLDRYRGLESVSLGNSIMGAPLSEMIWPIALDWPTHMIPEDLRNIQDSDVEMLLVSGTVDVSTPPRTLDEARPHFHKAQIVLLPEFSHVGDVETLQPAALERLVTTYYDTGVADSSLYVYEPVSFKPGMSLTLIARLLVAAMILLPALLIVGFIVFIRGLRRRAARSAGLQQRIAL
jgi:pimeloyl-ACP methyl ester carboxylesterase